MSEEPVQSPGAVPTGSVPLIPGPGNLVRLGAAFYGVVTLFAIGYATFDRIVGSSGGEEPFLGLSFPKPTLWLAGIAIGAVIVGVVHVGLRVWPAVEDGARAMARILGPVTRRQAVVLALFSAVGEELLFRGALWPHLGLVGTTLLFGLVHVIPLRALWGYPLFALGAGLLLGLLRDASGSVFPPILAHFTVNALNLAWLGAQHARLTRAPAPAPDAPRA